MRYPRTVVSRVRDKRIPNWPDSKTRSWLSYGDLLADSSRLVNDLRPLLFLVKLMFYLFLWHHYMLCMGEISVGGAPIGTEVSTM